MRWRNILFGLIIVVLIAGAVYMNQSENERSQDADIEEEQTDSETTNNDPEREADSDSNLAEPDRDVKPVEGFAAKDFTLETLQGEEASLYENNGKPTFLNFWASWCPPCREEMPYIQEAYDTYGDEVNFLMVDLTFNDNFDVMTKYVEENEFTFPIPLDETGDVMKDYQVVAIPTTFIVTEDGIISHKIPGSIPEKSVKNIMKDITN